MAEVASADLTSSPTFAVSAQEGDALRRIHPTPPSVWVPCGRARWGSEGEGSIENAALTLGGLVLQRHLLAEVAFVVRGLFLVGLVNHAG